MAGADPLLRHEALHMSLFLCEAVGAQLLEHPAVAARPACAALAERAHDALWALYQALGADEDGPPAEPA